MAGNWVSAVVGNWVSTHWLVIGSVQWLLISYLFDLSVIYGHPRGQMFMALAIVSFLYCQA